MSPRKAPPFSDVLDERLQELDFLIRSELEGELAARRNGAAERQRRWRAGVAISGGSATSRTVAPAGPSR